MTQGYGKVSFQTSPGGSAIRPTQRASHAVQDSLREGRIAVWQKLTVVLRNGGGGT